MFLLKDSYDIVLNSMEYFVKNEKFIILFLCNNLEHKKVENVNVSVTL